MLISSTSFKISFSCVICVLNSLTDFSHSLYAFSAFNNSALFCSIFFSSFDFSFKAAVLFSNLSFPRKFSFRLFCSSIAAEYEDISVLRFVIDSLILLIFSLVSSVNFKISAFRLNFLFSSAIFKFKSCFCSDISLSFPILPFRHFQNQHLFLTFRNYSPQCFLHCRKYLFSRLLYCLKHLPYPVNLLRLFGLFYL